MHHAAEDEVLRLLLTGQQAKDTMHGCSLFSGSLLAPYFQPSASFWVIQLSWLAAGPASGLFRWS